MTTRPLFDDHVHSCFSIDSDASIAALCQAALAAGLSGLAITDHFDTDPLDTGYGVYDFGRIRTAVEQARRVYGGRLAILTGAEVCFQPPFTRRVVDFLGACPLDFVLGSVHYVRRELVRCSYFARHPAGEAYDAYFAAVEETVASGLFDSVGHLDVIRRYGLETGAPLDLEPHWPRIERILRLMIDRGTALEINASGWRRGCGGPFPLEAILRRYGELGGRRITAGSDAHSVAQVGCDVARALDLARRLGFTHLTRYVGRQPQLIPL